MGNTLKAAQDETRRARALIRGDLEQAGELGLGDLLRAHNGPGGMFSAAVVYRAVFDMVEEGEANLTDDFRVSLSHQDEHAPALAR